MPCPRSLVGLDVILLIIISVMTLSTAVPVANEMDDLVQIDLILESSNPDLRVRRAADSNLPDHLSFSVPLHGSNVELRLKRSRLLKTVTSDAESTEAANLFSENAAVYTDLSRGSAMIVKRDADEYSLTGSFVHANTEWNLEPLDRKKRDAGERAYMLHHMKPMRAQNDVISFVGDEIFDTEEREELVNIWRKKEGLKPASPPPPQQQQGHQQQHHRQKRAATQHVVEMAFIADYADYQNWVALKGAARATTEMRLWYTYVAESINIRYETIRDPDIAISTTVTVLKILTRDADDDFIEDLTDEDGDFSGTSGLISFRRWHQSQNDIPLSDHYMLFTGFDILGASGIALGDRVCTVSSVSITENTFSGSVGGVAAHELGHSLSALHDANTGGACSDSNQYIMATVFSTPVRSNNVGNPWRFSSCSINAFKDYLSGVTCTRPENTSDRDDLPAPIEGRRAGQVLSRDEQCRVAKKNEQSFFCETIQRFNGGIESLCGGMYCNLPGSGGSCETTVPQEYTVCGVNKWCVAGKCIEVSQGAQTSTTSTPTTATTATETTTTTTEETTTTTTQEPTTTTTSTTTEEPTTTTTPTTTTSATTESTTSTTTTTSDSMSTSTSTSPEPPTTTTPSPTEPTTQDQRDTTATITTTTTSSPDTTTTIATTTTDAPSGPTSFNDCTPFIFQRDWRGWWNCIRSVLQYQREQQQRRREEQRQRERERRREEERQRNQRRRG